MDKADPLQSAIEALADRNWDLAAIEKRFQGLVENGIPRRKADPQQLLEEKSELLDRVQQRAEEYCYLTRSCAKGSALALMEAFGVGSMEIVRAMAPFPGLAMSGGICGPVAGGLAAIGLFFSDADPANHENIAPYIAGREFVQRFEKAFGSLQCPDIQEKILGKAYDPFAGLQELEAFNQSGAREKCPAAPGLGARLAAEILLENMESRP
jgi:C_GCAxxG_C_C family probable redox protein